MKSSLLRETNQDSNWVSASPNGSNHETACAEVMDALPIRAIVHLSVIDWQTDAVDDEEALPDGRHLRVKVQKEVRGDLVGESIEDLRMSIIDRADADSHVRFEAIERLMIRIGDRSGGFEVRRSGFICECGQEVSVSHIVVGSGIGVLDGMVGEARLIENAAGTDTLELTYRVLPMQ